MAHVKCTSDYIIIMCSPIVMVSFQDAAMFDSSDVIKHQAKPCVVKIKKMMLELEICHRIPGFFASSQNRHCSHEFAAAAAAECQILNMQYPTLQLNKKVLTSLRTHAILQYMTVA
eukprot:scpid44213/ scgid22203/ 